jgi:hypothetical protein
VSGDYRTRKRQAKEKQLGLLAEQYEAALMESAMAAGPTRVQAEQRAAQIDERMKELDDEIRKLALAPVDTNRDDDNGPEPSQVHDLLRQCLHRIDFRQVEGVIRRLLDADSDSGRAGLLLFQRCSRMSGRRCAERIVSILKAEGGELFRHFPVGLRPGDRNDAAALLRHLAAHLNLSIEARPRSEQLARVSGGLCGSLQAGSIALIDVSGCDWLTYDEPEVLRWLVTDFWSTVLAELQATARQLPGSVTLIGLLFFDDELPAGALEPAHCCGIDNVCPARVLEIELRQWSRTEVLDWLMRFGMPGHPQDDARRIADIVMRVSAGMPSLIENELLNRCAQLQPAL